MSFISWKCCLIVFVLMTDIPTSKTTSTKVTQSNNDVENLIDGKTHFVPVLWDPTRKLVLVFNVSDDSPLRIILIREKKGHCEMFYLRFKNHGDKMMIVCVAELNKNNKYLKERCDWVNNTNNVVVNQGNLYGIPKDCGPWYVTVSTNYPNVSELALEVSEPYDTLTFRWFRILTNFAFIPAIIIAFKRSLYAECIVYFLNFFVSSVYHLCEAEMHCFKGYDRLRGSDIYCSDLSIIVTVWTMTGLKEPLKHLVFLATSIMLQYAVMETTRTMYHFFINLVFCALPLCYITFQYIYRNVRYKGCYPSRKRWICNLIPGIILASTGALVNIVVTESENYYYVHSIWHLTIMLSVAFLLPLKDDEDQWHLREVEKSSYVSI